MNFQIYYLYFSAMPIVPFSPLRPRSDSNARERRNSIGFLDSPSPNSVPYAQSPPNMEGPILFEAPELAEETLMDVSTVCILVYSAFSSTKWSVCINQNIFFNKN